MASTVDGTVVGIGGGGFLRLGLPRMQALEPATAIPSDDSPPQEGQPTVLPAALSVAADATGSLVISSGTGDGDEKPVTPVPTTTTTATAFGRLYAGAEDHRQRQAASRERATAQRERQLRRDCSFQPSLSPWKTPAGGNNEHSNGADNKDDGNGDGSANQRRKKEVSRTTTAATTTGGSYGSLDAFLRAQDQNEQRRKDRLAGLTQAVRTAESPEQKSPPRTAAGRRLARRLERGGYRGPIAGWEERYAWYMAARLGPPDADAGVASPTTTPERRASSSRGGGGETTAVADVAEVFHRLYNVAGARAERERIMALLAEEYGGTLGEHIAQTEPTEEQQEQEQQPTPTPTPPPPPPPPLHATSSSSLLSSSLTSPLSSARFLKLTSTPRHRDPATATLTTATSSNSVRGRGDRLFSLTTPAAAAEGTSPVPSPSPRHDDDDDDDDDDEDEREEGPSLYPYDHNHRRQRQSVFDALYAEGGEIHQRCRCATRAAAAAEESACTFVPAVNPASMALIVGRAQALARGGGGGGGCGNHTAARRHSNGGAASPATVTAAAAAGSAAHSQPQVPQQRQQRQRRKSRRSDNSSDTIGNNGSYTRDSVPGGGDALLVRVERLAQERERRVAAARLAEEQAALRECTFRPRLAPRSTTLTAAATAATAATAGETETSGPGAEDSNGHGPSPRLVKAPVRGPSSAHRKPPQSSCPSTDASRTSTANNQSTVKQQQQKSQKHTRCADYGLAGVTGHADAPLTDLQMLEAELLEIIEVCDRRAGGV